MASEADWQAQLGYEVSGALLGGAAPDEGTGRVLQAVMDQIPTLWAMWGGRPFPVTYLYARRAALDTLMGQLWLKVDGTLGPLALRHSQRWEHLRQLREDTVKEIERIETRLRAGQMPAVGPLLQTAPVMAGRPAVRVVEAGGVRTAEVEVPFRAWDPNDPRWRGGRFRRWPGWPGTTERLP